MMDLTGSVPAPALGTVSQAADAFVGRVTSVPFLRDGSQISQQIFYTNVSKMAWDRHLESLSPDQKAQMLRPDVTNVDEYMEYVRKASQKHKKGSRTIKVNEFVRPFFRTLGRYIPVAAAAAQADPYPSAIVIGGVMCLLKISEDFAVYQETLAKWISKLSFKANLLIENDLCIYQYDSHIQAILVDIYGDILLFLKEALVLYENHKKTLRGGLRMLGRAMKEDFAKVFEPIISSFETHMEEYKAATKRCDGQWLMQFYAHAANEAMQQEKMRKEHRQAHHNQQLFYQEQRQQNKDVMSSLSDVKSTIQADNDRHNAEMALIEANQERLRKEAQKTAILNWIRSIELKDEHDRLDGLRTEGTAIWLQNNARYLEWETATSSKYLWVRGKPGSGKSVLAAETWNHLEQKRSEEVAVAHFYCRVGDLLWSEPAPILSSILNELLAQTEGLDPEVERLFKIKAQIQPKGPTLIEVEKLLSNTLSHFTEVFILVDGLDECSDPAKVLGVFQKISVKSTLRVIIFSRPKYQSIEKALKNSLVVHIDDESNADDLKAFIAQELSESDSNWADSPELLAVIRNRLLEKSEGVFLYAHLQAKRLNAALSPDQVFERLAAFPKGLNKTYEAALERIKQNQDEDQEALAWTILMWVANSFRPLSRRELLQAVSIPENQRSFAQVSWLLSDQNFTTLCADLVEVNKEGYYHPIHSSLREYLIEQVNVDTTKFAQYRARQGEAHYTMATVCLTYLLMADFQDISPISLADLREIKRRHPFLDYAASHWGDHLRSLSQNTVSELVWQFVDNQAASKLAMQIILAETEAHSRLLATETGNSLHLLAYFGLSLVAEARPDIRNLRNVKDQYERTPLDHALVRGHRDMCIWLLQDPEGLEISDRQPRGKYSAFHMVVVHEWEDVMDILISNRYNLDENKVREKRTPLAQAAWQGFSAGVEKLIASGADKNLQDAEGKSPLILAVENEHIGIAQKLLRADVEIDIQDNEGVTALHRAAENGELALVNSLLEKGAQILPAGEVFSGQTPMHFAARRNHVKIMNSLHQFGCDFDIESEDGYTPVHVAAFNDSLDAASMLRDSHADMVAKGGENETLLMISAGYSSEAFVRVVLEFDSELESKDKDGFTALMWAAKEGNTAICKFLFDRCADLEASDKNNNTALILAIVKKKTEAAEFLLSMGASAQHRGMSKAPSLHWAAYCGLGKIVNLLSDRGADPTVVDENGDTALHYAAYAGQVDSIKHLFEAFPYIDAHPKNKKDSTPLHQAAEMDYMEIARLILRKSEQLGKDQSSNLPTHLAAWRGNEEIFTLLLEKCDINEQGWFGRTFLGIAALRGHEKLVKLLLARGARTNISDDEGNEPLHLAIRRQHRTIIDLLVDKGADLHARTNKGVAIIHMAAGLGDVRLLKRLVDAGCEVNLKDTWFGTTPFLEAVASGNVEAVAILLEHNSDALHDEDYVGSSALHRAVENGHMEMLEKLLSLGLDAITHDTIGVGLLYTAVLSGRANMVSRLLELGIPVDRGSDSYNSVVPLIAASSEGFIEVVDILLNNCVDVNTALDYSKVTALIAAAAARRRKIVAKLMAAGADPFWRDLYGKNALDYGIEDELVYAEFGDARLKHQPLSELSRNQILGDTIRSTLEDLINETAHSAITALDNRANRMSLLAYSLLYIHHDQENDAAKIAFFEIWTRSSPNGRVLECRICNRNVRGVHAFLCTKCIELWLCSTCYFQYLKEERRCPKGHRVLEELEKELEYPMSILLPMFEDGAIYVLVAAVNIFELVGERFQGKLEAYQRWELEHNNNSQYASLRRPGQEMLRLIERAKNFIALDEDKVLSSERDEKEKDLRKDFQEFYRMQSIVQENPPFACCGHEYVEIKEADFNAVKQQESIFDENDRVCTNWLTSLLDTYKSATKISDDVRQPARQPSISNNLASDTPGFETI